MCTDDDEDHNSLVQGYDSIKLNRHVKDNCNGLTNHLLATSYLGFDLPTEHKKPNDAIISVTKILTQKKFKPGK